MVKKLPAGLPDTSPVKLLESVKVALRSAVTVCPEMPLYVQVMENFASAPAATDPDRVRVLPPVQETEAVPEMVSVPESVTADEPKLWMVTLKITVPLPRVGSLLSGVFEYPKAVIFGMLETKRVSCLSP